MFNKRLGLGSRVHVMVRRTIGRTTGAAPCTRRKSRICYSSALVAVVAISLPLLASTAPAVAASPRSTPPIGKQLAELKGSNTVASATQTTRALKVGTVVHSSATPDSIVGDWNVTYGNPDVVAITLSGGTYTETAVTPIQVVGASCDLPAGMIIATFSSTGGNSYSGQHGLWYTNNCAFAYYTSLTLTLSSDGGTLTGDLGNGEVLTFTRVYFTVSGRLNGVAAISASNAWTVGSTSSGKTLIVHWNGIAWTRVPSPSPAGSSLEGVAATSARSAWAVGYRGSYPKYKTLILHWNGTSWKQVSSPSPTSSQLSGVAATSATNAWAVGSTKSGSLMLRWNGTVWKQVPSPGGSQLSGVAATSATNAWAVGYTSSGKSLILHWNGATWTRASSPSPDTVNFLDGVAVTAAGSAWAVGDISDCGCGPGERLILHWNGRVWKSSYNSELGDLDGVAVVSARSVWVVGLSGEGIGPTKTLILHWNGTLWKQVPSPSPGTDVQFGGARLSSVAATSATNAWAVGSYVTGSGSDKTLILHWNGKAWK